MADQEPTLSTGGTKDGTGAADHDKPYQFGHKSTSAWTHPFSEVEFARLLIAAVGCGQRTSTAMLHKSDGEHQLFAVLSLCLIFTHAASKAARRWPHGLWCGSLTHCETRRAQNWLAHTSGGVKLRTV
jgi:hypothetical protein